MSGHGARPSATSILRSVLALAVATAAFFSLKLSGLVESGGPLFALGYLVIAGQAAGALAAFVWLPRLTGYLIAGLLAGPHGFALFSIDEVKSLSIVNTLALALIALQAGAEMTLPMLARTYKSVTSSALAQALVVVPLMAAAFYGLHDAIPFTAALPTNLTVALAILWGVLAMPRSPAVALAVLSETRAKGPVADFVLGTVVFLDVLILPLFAVAASVARGQFLGEPFELSALAHLGNELFASAAAGVTIGLVAAVLFRVIDRERVLLTVVLAYAGTALCGYLRYDTLLVFVIGGFVISNVTKQGPRLHATSETLAGAVMIVFFATAGAKLDLAALIVLWPLVLGLFALRVFGIFCAVKLGHAVARDPSTVRANGWLGLVSQAGVTIGLATIVGDSLPVVGPAFASLVIAVVGLNELVGGALFKLALGRAGELPPAEPNATSGGVG